MTRSLFPLVTLGLALAAFFGQNSYPWKMPQSWVSSSVEVDDDEVSLMQSPSNVLAQLRPVRSDAMQAQQDAMQAQQDTFSANPDMSLQDYMLLRSSLLETLSRAAKDGRKTVAASTWPLIAMVCFAAAVAIALAWFYSCRSGDGVRYSQHPYMTGNTWTDGHYAATPKSQAAGRSASSQQPVDPAVDSQESWERFGGHLSSMAQAAEFKQPPGLVGTQVETRFAVALSDLEKCDANDDPECTVDIMAVNTGRPACQMAIVGGTRLDIRLPNQRSAYISIQAPSFRGPAFNIYDDSGGPIGHLQSKSPGVSEIVMHAANQVMIVRGQSSNLEFSVTFTGGKPIAMGKINNEDFSCPHFEVRVLPGVDAVLIMGIMLALAVTTDD